jgi:hypothetical protein
VVDGVGGLCAIAEGEDLVAQVTSGRGIEGQFAVVFLVVELATFAKLKAAPSSAQTAPE